MILPTAAFCMQNMSSVTEFLFPPVELDILNLRKPKLITNLKGRKDILLGNVQRGVLGFGVGQHRLKHRCSKRTEVGVFKG